jgi:hypothetical protein
VEQHEDADTDRTGTEHPATAVARPPLLVVVVAAVALEAALLVGVAVLEAAAALRGEAAVPGSALALGAMALLVGGFLLLCARGLWHGRRWARGPVATWQLLQLAVAVPMVLGPRWALGVPVVAVSLLTGIGLLTRPVVAATTSQADPPVT